jgi:lysozyme family protein
MYWKHNATAADVRLMPLSVAKDIYKSKYWDAIHGDELPAGLDLAVFDYGVNSGIHRAAAVLQRILGIPDDGIIGPLTLENVNERASDDLIRRVCDERLHFLQRLDTWRLFGRGWGRRVAEVKALALKMAAEPAPKTETAP